MTQRRSLTYILSSLAVSLAMLAGSAAAEAPKAPGELAVTGPKPKPVPPPKPEEIDAALRRGVEFLLARQNPDGSWGSAHNTKGLNIYAPVPGAHQAFRAAVTSMCVSALIETGGNGQDVEEALDRGEAWMFKNLPQVRRATADTTYNNWAHAYSLQALVRMYLRRPDDAKRQAQIKELLLGQIDRLGRYECVDGGWAYYDFNAQTQRPSGSTLCFVTAAALVGLYEAKGIGVEIPEPMVQRATASILRQRKPDYTYVYGEYLKNRPMHPVNRPGGSLGRSQACNVAMRLWGDKTVTDEVLTTWLDRLFARNMWLDIGRKRPIPHESYFSVAGYFFYFGHYYAALCIEQLPAAQRAPYQDHLGQVLLALQEKDGSWWDYPLYDYHQQYGTAFALMSLVRCRHR